MTLRDFCSKYRFEDSEIVAVERYIPFYSENGEFLIGIKNKDITRSILSNDNNEPSAWLIMTFRSEIHSLPNKDKWSEQTINELISIIFSENCDNNDNSSDEQPQEELTHTINVDDSKTVEFARTIETVQTIIDDAPTLLESIADMDLSDANNDTIKINYERELPIIDEPINNNDFQLGE